MRPTYPRLACDYVHRLREGRATVTAQDDRYSALGLLDVLCERESMQVVVLDGDPISKARPRFTRGGHTYTPTKTIEGEKTIARALKGVPKFRSNVAVVCIFHRKTRQRIDVDNLLKAVLDGGTRANIWDDDSQVTALIGIIGHDPSHPRTVIALGEHESTLTRGDAAMVACQACGKKFFPGGQRRDKAKWCSRECRMTLAALVPCPTCGIPFKKTNGYRKFCSVACRGKAQTLKAETERETRTHCKRGHELTDENTHRLPDGRRRCRTCQAEAARAYRSGLLKADQL